MSEFECYTWAKAAQVIHCSDHPIKVCVLNTNRVAIVYSNHVLNTTFGYELHAFRYEACSTKVCVGSTITFAKVYSGPESPLG